MMSAPAAILTNLNQAISQLEDAVHCAKITLSRKPNCPTNALERLDEYSEIISKQRSLLPALQLLFQQNKWSEVHQIIQRVNALASMIRDDARELLTTLSDPNRKLDRPTDPH